MKLVECFDIFMSEVVNLNQSRIQTLEDRVKVVERFVSSSELSFEVESYATQGSWAHRTIIKPPKNKEFDADLLVYLNGVPSNSPSSYVDELYDAFRSNGTYGGMVTRGTRCVTLDYSGDFHLDVIPCIHRFGLFGGDKYYVCNRLSGEYEETDPEAFTSWFLDRNSTVGGDRLIEVVRLFKYLRDIKQTFTAKSILLTALLAEQVMWTDNIDSANEVSDLPSCLKTLLGRLDDFLQLNQTMPTVSNPVLSTEDFNRHWDQEKYEIFRSKIHQYREWVDDAFVEENRAESVRKWRRVFGDQFAKEEVARGASTSLLRESLGQLAELDIVDVVRRAGHGILSRFPRNLPHVEEAEWLDASRQIPVRVTAVLCDSNKNPIGELVSGDVVSPNLWIRFESRLTTGTPQGFEARWRVVNTGDAAAAGGVEELRGGFYKSDAGRFSRFEQTKYHGVHWVEAFILNTRTGSCVGRSDRFFVVID